MLQETNTILSDFYADIFILLVMQLLRNRLVATARSSIKKNASLGQLYGKMQEAYNQMQTPLVHQVPSLKVNILFVLAIWIVFC